MPSYLAVLWFNAKTEQAYGKPGILICILVLGRWLTTWGHCIRLNLLISHHRFPFYTSAGGSTHFSVLMYWVVTFLLDYRVFLHPLTIEIYNIHTVYKITRLYCWGLTSPGNIFLVLLNVFYIFLCNAITRKINLYLKNSGTSEMAIDFTLTLSQLGSN